MSHKGSHKYLRTKIHFPKIHYAYRCTLPDCYHRLQEYDIIGKLNKCWNCNNEHIIMPRSGVNKKPICDNCWNMKYGGKDVDKNKAIEAMLKDIGAL